MKRAQPMGGRSWSRSAGSPASQPHVPRAGFVCPTWHRLMSHSETRCVACGSLPWRTVGPGCRSIVRRMTHDLAIIVPSRSNALPHITPHKAYVYAVRAGGCNGCHRRANAECRCGSSTRATSGASPCDMRTVAMLLLTLTHATSYGTRSENIAIFERTGARRGATHERHLCAAHIASRRHLTRRMVTSLP